MGKIRVKTLGDEEAEKKQKEETRKKQAAKKQEADKKTEDNSQEKPAEKETKKPVSAYAAKKAAEKTGKNKRSQKYLAVEKLVEKKKEYTLKEALALLPKLQRAKFDETIELHINTIDKGISGSVTLPHGTGKKVRIAIANQSADPKGVEALVKRVEEGTVDFDILLATPDAMPKLAKIARILGPRGLMPNPKNGTVSPKPEAVAKKYEGGQVNFKTEAKFPILHIIVGKMSFGETKLNENIQAAIMAVETKNIKNITVKSTMSQGLRLSLTNI